MSIAKSTKPLSPPKNTPDRDLVETPPSLAKAIIDNLPIQGLALDPSMGKGRVFFNLLQTLPGVYEAFGCEITEGGDFFHWNTSVDWIVTNPPWSKYREFTLHAYRHSKNVAFLTTVSHDLAMKARIRDMKQANFGFRKVLFVPSPKFGWPQSGFQLGVCWKQAGYCGPCEFQTLDWVEAIE